MVALALVIGLFAAFYAGYKYEKVLASIRDLRELLSHKAEVKPPVKPSNTSDVVIDPFDIVQQAKHEHDEALKKLNPDYED